MQFAPAGGLPGFLRRVVPEKGPSVFCLQLKRGLFPTDKMYKKLSRKGTVLLGPSHLTLSSLHTLAVEMPVII